MDKIYKIKYVDAYYTYTEINQTKLSLHEAYGYVKRNKNNLIVAFIKKRGANKKDEPALGLVIPDSALISSKDSYNKKILGDIEMGDKVAIEWRDVVIFDFGDPRDECPTMYTEGILFRVENDHIILKDPETIRTNPSPIKNHPINKPNYYVIPVVMITDITKIKQK